MNAGLIEPTGYGLVDFAIPGLREYMPQHPPRPYEQASSLMDTGTASVSVFQAVVRGPLAAAGSALFVQLSERTGWQVDAALLTRCKGSDPFPVIGRAP